VLDGVHMVWAGLLEESLKVGCWWTRLTINTVPSGHDVLLARATRLLVIVGRDCYPLRASLSPILATLGALLGALDGDAG
jgi:hypothetical protein